MARTPPKNPRDQSSHHAAVPRAMRHASYDKLIRSPLMFWLGIGLILLMWALMTFATDNTVWHYVETTISVVGTFLALFAFVGFGKPSVL